MESEPNISDDTKNHHDDEMSGLLESIKKSDIKNFVSRHDWILTDEEEKLYDENNNVRLAFHRNFPWYESSKNFYLAIIRMKEITEIRQIIDYYIKQKETFMFMTRYRDIFVSFASYAIPSDQAIDQIVTWFNEYRKISPTAKFVDFGAGSGLFSLLLNDAGIPKDSLIAIDKSDKNKKLHKFGRKYFDIIEDENYKVDPNDIFFVAWGFIHGNALEDYIEKGGRCVIILGENEGGCTHPSGDYFKDDKEWNVINIKVPAGANIWKGDILSYNTKIIQI